ncbi:MAG: ABC transporter permease, partial [Solirubrobacterales bacterium]|nr:ABC transporter permease [Solirubrobacterales bacterium]
PSALGGGWRRFLNLTWLVATTDFKLTYFGSVLGYVWSFAQPLLFFGVLYLVFAVILAGSFTRVPDFPVLLLMNIVLFNFFVAGTSGAVSSVVVRENLVRKMHFPRLVIPLSVVCTAAMQLALNLLVVLAFMTAYGVHPRLTWLLLPVILLVLAVLTTGCAMLLSALYVRYRDVAPIWGVVTQALFYASPVFITIEAVQKHGHNLGRFYLFNPLGAILQQARHWMIGGSPGTPAIMGGYQWVLVPVAIMLFVWALGYWVFSRMAPRIAEEL